MLETCEKISQFDAVVIRNEASRLLDQLLSERQAAEQRMAESGKRDLIKTITGRSSLDQAIQQTRDMIRDMDKLVCQMNDELASEADLESLDPMLIGAGAVHAQ